MANKDVAGGKQGAIRQPLKTGTGLKQTTKFKQDTAPYHKRQLMRKRILSAEGLNALTSSTRMRTGGNQTPPQQQLQQQPGLQHHDGHDHGDQEHLGQASGPAEQRKSLSGYDLILQKLDTLNSNQQVTNSTIADLSGSLGEMSQRVTSNSEQIAGIQQELRELRVNPGPAVDRSVQSAVQSHVAAMDNVWNDKLNLLVNKKMGELDSSWTRSRLSRLSRH